jgi:hypothetical protein
MLRQPKTTSKEDKYEYVEQVIGMLNMEEFADAVVGVPGEGLNVEQRCVFSCLGLCFASTFCFSPLSSILIH